MVAFVHVLPEHRTAHLGFSGRLVAEDFVAALEHLYEQPGWQPGFALVHSFEAVRSVVLDLPGLDDIIAFVEATEAQMGYGPVLLVTRQIDLAPIFDLYVRKRTTGPRPVRRLRTLDEAEQHLGLPAGTLSGTP